MPFQSPGDKFIGRVDDIWRLHDSLFRDETAVLQGAGVVAGGGPCGLGKTQLAVEYAQRFGGRNDWGSCTGVPRCGILEAVFNGAAYYCASLNR